MTNTLDAAQGVLAEAGRHMVDQVSSQQGVWELFTRGGNLMWLILLCSVIGLAFIFERIVSLRRSVVAPRRQIRQLKTLCKQGEVDEALELSADSKTPFAHVVHCCLLRAEAPGYEMEAALEEAGARVLYDLRRGSRPLGVIADVAPLLGLMGTVTGMIKAFDVVAHANALGKAQLLAEGIGEALLTTAFGLSVAIPALLANQYFRARAEGWVREIEDTCLEMLSEFRRHVSKGRKA